MKNRFWAIFAIPLCVAGCVNPAINSARNTKALPAYTAPTPAQKTVIPQKDPDEYRTSDSGRSYSLTLKNADLRDVLLLLSKESGVSIVAERGLRGTVQVDAKNKKLGELLYTILKPLGYTATVENGMILVGRPQLSTRTFRMNYIKDKRNSTSNMNVSGTSGSVSVSSEGKSDYWGVLESSLEMLVFGTSGQGKRDSGGYIRGEVEKKIDTKTDSGAAKSSTDKSAPTLNAELADPLLASTQLAENKLKQLLVNEIAGIIQVTDYQDNLDKIAAFLADVEEGSKRQVLIQAHIMEVSLSDAFSLGINWQTVINKGASFSLTQGAVDLTSALSSSTNIFKFGAKGKDLNVFVDALKDQGNVNMLSSPKISALNNQKAVIKLTTKQVSWTQTQTTVASGGIKNDITYTPQIDEVGIFLDVTPQISDDGKITMQIHPSVSEVKEFSYPNGDKTLGSSKPIINIREIDTMVEARSGETIVIAGLISDKLTENKRSVPLLGDIPYLGTLFSSTSQDRTKSELVIMMTPYVLNVKSIEDIRKEHESRMQSIGGDFHLINNLGSMITEKSSRDWIMQSEPHRAKPKTANEDSDWKNEPAAPKTTPTSAVQPETPSSKPAVPKLLPPPRPEVNKPAEPAVKASQAPSAPAIIETDTPVAVPPTQAKPAIDISPPIEKAVSPTPSETISAPATTDIVTSNMPKAAAPVIKAPVIPTLEGITTSDTGIRMEISNMKQQPTVLRETKNGRVIIQMPGVKSAIGNADLQLESLGFQRAKVARHSDGIWVVLHSKSAELPRIVPHFDDNGLTIEAAPPPPAAPVLPVVQQAKTIEKPLPAPVIPVVTPVAAAPQEKKAEQPTASKQAPPDVPPLRDIPQEKSAMQQQVAMSTNATSQQTLYRAGVTAYKIGDCTEAVKLLSSFLASYPQSPFAQDAVVYRSDCQERTGLKAR